MSAIIYRDCRSIESKYGKTCSEIPMEAIQMILDDKNHRLGVEIIQQCPNEENCEYKEDRIKKRKID